MTEMFSLITVLCHTTLVLGKLFTYEVNNGLLSGDLQCSSTAIISCKFAEKTPNINWIIAPDVANSSHNAAECSFSTCDINPSFSAEYGFTFNETTGVTNITIKNVTFEHADLQFRCDDGSKPVPFKPTVTVPPDEYLTKINITYTDREIELRVQTSCIYPTNSVNITWFSKPINGTDRKMVPESSRTVTLCTDNSICIIANKSAHAGSILNIDKINEGNVTTGAFQKRTFEVQIQFATGNFVLAVGNFSVADHVKPRTSTGLKLSIIILYLVTPMLVSFYLCLGN